MKDTAALFRNYNSNYYDSIILAVGHNEFKDLGINKIKSFARDNCVIYDLKYIFKEDEVDLSL